MRVRADEHIAKAIVVAIRDIALDRVWEISSVHDVGHVGDDDVHWITKFADDGGDAILSADRDFFTLEPQVNAVFDTGLKLIHLPPKWGQARGYLQAAHILQWWRRIEARIEQMEPRECYRPPWNIKETGELLKVSLDFAKAQKRRKRMRKR